MSVKLFGEFNFTIDENDPNDHEVGIDPEMLKRIFENLLKTIKIRVHSIHLNQLYRICVNKSLIQYLKTNLEDCDEDAIKTFLKII